MATKNIDPQKSEKNQDNNGNKSSIWRFFIWAVVLALIFSYFFGMFTDDNGKSIPYSEFKQQIRSGNVSEVTIKGQNITGSLNEPITSTENNDTIKHSEFSTIKPSVEDQELITMLEQNDVIINAETTDNSWWTSALILLLPWILIIGYFVYASRRLQSQMKGGGGGMPGGGGIFGVGKSRAKRIRKEMISVRYDDVAGLKNAKQDLNEVVDYLKDPGKFTQLGATIPKGVLLMGPPGTGKTLLARATAGEAGVPFFSTSGSEFIEMFVGVGASRVRDMFENAKKESPAIIFIDELDSVGRARGTGVGGSHDEREQTLNQILSEMDGFEPHQSVVVIAATNRPDVLDPALTRPGRFDRQITLELPQKNARVEILKIHSQPVPMEESVNLESIASRTVGFSGADLKNVVNEAALFAGRKGKENVGMDEFEEAVDKILLGAEREDKIGDEEKRVVAYHEAGHALVAKLLPETDPLQKVTIIARGRTLGATQQVPPTDRHNLNRQYLLSRIAVSLGGRASERLVFNELTNGAASDLKQVTKIARKMVCQWGMSDKLGPTTFNQGEEHAFLGKELSSSKDYSEDTAREIDKEIRRIVMEQEERAHKVLNENREKLDKLALALIEHETMENGEIDQLLGLDGYATKKKENGENKEENNGAEKKEDSETKTSSRK